MAKANLEQHCDTEALSDLLATPEITALIADLEAIGWTGRPGYLIRVMVGMDLVKSLHCLPTWTRTVALVRDHAALRAALVWLFVLRYLLPLHGQATPAS
jgi:hypothetical protein